MAHVINQHTEEIYKKAYPGQGKFWFERQNTTMSNGDINKLWRLVLADDNGVGICTLLLTDSDVKALYRKLAALNYS